MNWIDQRPDDAMDGAFTAVAPGPVASVEPTAFREAMSRLGAAVHVVTTAGAAGKSGFTATAVCSVSDQPAMLLVCLNRRSNSAPLLAQNGVFCVNTLRRRRREARRSVRRTKRRASRTSVFRSANGSRSKTGAPVLASAVVAFDCRTIEIKAMASHNVVFGAVEAVRLGPRRAGARLSRPGL